MSQLDLLNLRMKLRDCDRDKGVRDPNLCLGDEGRKYMDG